MKVVLMMQLEVEYETNDVPIETLKKCLISGPLYLADEGFFTQETDAKVVNWTSKVYERR